MSRWRRRRRRMTTSPASLGMEPLGVPAPGSLTEVLMIRRLLVVVAVTLASLAASAGPSTAVVGGQDASPGEYPAVAEITFGPFLCTGTLIETTRVLSGG